MQNFNDDPIASAEDLTVRDNGKCRCTRKVLLNALKLDFKI